jgi:hypothetical protein
MISETPRAAVRRQEYRSGLEGRWRIAADDTFSAHGNYPAIGTLHQKPFILWPSLKSILSAYFPDHHFLRVNIHNNLNIQDTRRSGQV